MRGRSNPQKQAPAQKPSAEYSELAAEQEFTSSELALKAIGAALDQKAIDVRGISISHVSDLADYFVIVSGTSERHVKGIADKVKQVFELAGERPISVQGYDAGQWVILDFGNIVVHVFYEPARQYYSFDDLWQRAQEIALPSDLEKQVRKLRTGIYPAPKSLSKKEKE